MKKLLGVLIAIFALSLVASFVLFVAILDVLHQFELISLATLFKISCISALVFSIACVVVAILLLKTDKKTRFGNWLSANSAKLLLAYTLLTVFFFSIRSDLILSIEDMKGILSLCWTIMGISIGIFLIWNVVAMDYLEKRKPNKPESDFPSKTWQYIQDKSDFYSSAILLLSNVNLLLINLMDLVITTVFVYISLREETILSQSMTILALFLCTNTLVGLFLDILKPFNEKKKTILQETRVTNADVDLQNEIDKQTEITLAAIDAVENMKNASDEVKKQVISGILDSYSEKFEKSLKTESHTTR